MRGASRYGLPLGLGVMAAFGTIFGHVLGYMMITSDSHARAELLAATGHGHWNLWVAIGIGALVMGVSGYLRRHIQRGDRAVTRWSVMMSLVAFQVPTFLLLETLERAVAGGAHADDVRIIGIGLLAQVLVAALTAICLRLLARVIEYLVRRSTPLAPRVPAIALAVDDAWHITRRFVDGGRTSRGPPPRPCVV